MLILIILRGETCQLLTAVWSEICSDEWAGFNHASRPNSQRYRKPAVLSKKKMLVQNAKLEIFVSIDLALFNILK